MIFRTGDRGRAPDAHRRDELLAAAERHFGRHPDTAFDDDVVMIDGLELVYDPTGEPPFVLRPDCDRCDHRDVSQFPLEVWNLLGAAVRAQARTTCRDCRFLQLTTDAGISFTAREERPPQA